jgi:hypothetical protein
MRRPHTDAETGRVSAKSIEVSEMKEFSTKPPATPKSTHARAITPFDIHQTPGGAVTTTDGGGPVLTNVEVVVIFWGSYWAGTPAISADTFYQCFTGIVTGPYMTSMNQYRGVGPGTMLGQFVNTSSDPNNPYTNSDVETMLTTFLQNNPSCPPPVAGHNRFYAVVTQPGFGNTVGAEGEHLSFTFNGVQAFYARAGRSLHGSHGLELYHQWRRRRGRNRRRLQQRIRHREDERHQLQRAVLLERCR